MTNNSMINQTDSCDPDTLNNAFPRENGGNMASKKLEILKTHTPLFTSIKISSSVTPYRYAQIVELHILQERAPDVFLLKTEAHKSACSISKLMSWLTFCYVGHIEIADFHVTSYRENMLVVLQHYQYYSMFNN